MEDRPLTTRDASQHLSKGAWRYRSAGILWIAGGLAGFLFYVVHWNYIAKVFPAPLICLLIAACGLALCQRKRWATIPVIILAALVALLMLDVLAMLAFHHSF